MDGKTGVNGQSRLPRLMTEAESDEVQRLEESRRLAWGKFYHEQRRARRAEEQWKLWVEEAQDAQTALRCSNAALASSHLYIGALMLLVEMGEAEVAVKVLSTHSVMLDGEDAIEGWKAVRGDGDFDDAVFRMADRLIALVQTVDAEASAQ